MRACERAFYCHLPQTTPLATQASVARVIDRRLPTRCTNATPLNRRPAGARRPLCRRPTRSSRGRERKGTPACILSDYYYANDGYHRRPRCRYHHSPRPNGSSFAKKSSCSIGSYPPIYCVSTSTVECAVHAARSGVVADEKSTRCEIKR